MRKFIYVVFLLLFVSNLQAHKAHDDVLLKELKGIISKSAFESIKDNINDFSLESHYVYKNTPLDNKLLQILTADNFNKNEYISTLQEIYKDNPYAKNTSPKKSAKILEAFDKTDRSVLANTLKTINR